MLKVFVTTLFLIFGVAGMSQSDSLTAPFRRFPEPPPFQLLLQDSATVFKKADLKAKTPVVIMVFSPECSHCQHETEELVKHRDELKNVQIVMITMHPFEAMKKFITDYQLNTIPQITVGKDLYYLMPSFYALHNLPFNAWYSKKHKLINAFEGTINVSTVLEELKN